MALALLLQDDDVLFIDVVTNYSKSKSSSVSSHPVDKSSLITDHVSRDNPNFSIRGVISAADFHTTYTRPEELLIGGENNPPISPEYNQPVNGAVVNAPSSLLDLLPGSVQQFLSTSSFSSISVDPFRGYHHQVARDRLERVWEDSEIITILDYDFDISTGRSVAVRLIEDCVMTRFEDVEDVETGDSLTFNATFQKIRYAYIKEVDVEISQQQASPEVSDEAASEIDKGDQSESGAEVEDTPLVVEDAASLLQTIGLPEGAASLFTR